MIYELIIVGGGPGGVAAGVYAARKKIKTLLITDGFGGQSVVSADIKNWVGVRSVSGFDLGKMLEEHLRAQEDIKVIDGDLVIGVEKSAGGPAPSSAEGFTAKTQSGKEFQAKYLLVASGSRRRKLGVPGEEELDGKGVVYCSTCDAPVFKDKVVAVVGGGNAGLEAVVDLLPYASKIYLLEYSDKPRGDQLTREKVVGSGKVEVITMAETSRVLGDKFVTGLEYKDRRNGELKTLELDGVFVEIGAMPNSDFVRDLVQLNKSGEIIVDHQTQRTSCPGIWAAGDVTDVLYKQNNISAGDAVKAVLNIDEEMNKKK